MSPRVAILGSCVTRDIWSLPRFTIEDRRAVLALCRTSLASLFAEPCRGLAPPPRPLPHGVSPWEVRMVGHDLGKTGPANLVAFQPTHLILDLIDERFDLLRCGEQVATLSWEAHLLGLEAGPLAGFERLRPESEAADRLWREGVRRLAAFLDAALPQTRVILHDVRWATEHLTAEGGRRAFDAAWPVWPGRAARIEAQNARLARQMEILAAALPQAASLRAPKDLILGDEAHRWGLAPYHYVAAYYEAAWAALAQLGLA